MQFLVSAQQFEGERAPPVQVWLHMRSNSVIYTTIGVLLGWVQFFPCCSTGPREHVLLCFIEQSPTSFWIRSFGHIISPSASAAKVSPWQGTSRPGCLQ